MASIQVRPPTSFSIKTSTVGSSGGGGGVTASSTAPTLTVGNMWYDTSTNVLKVYDGSNWDSLGMGSDYDNDNKFEWKPDSTLSSGLLASFSNASGGELFSVTYDGAVALKVNSSSAPDEIAGGMYHDGSNLYIGVQ